MINETAFPSKALENHLDLTKMNVEKFDLESSGFQAKIQYLFKFDNGYKVSVISGFGARGNQDTPYELGLMHEGLGMVSLDCVTDDEDTVSGYNTEKEILDKLEIVKAQKRERDVE